MTSSYSKVLMMIVYLISTCLRRGYSGFDLTKTKRQRQGRRCQCPLYLRTPSRQYLNNMRPSNSRSRCSRARTPFIRNSRPSRRRRPCGRYQMIPPYPYLYSYWQFSLLDRAKSCDDVFMSGERISGVYELQPFNERISVYCNFDEQGYRWMVLQRRVDGTVDFFRNWEAYRNGFGDPRKEFWLGLEAIHVLGQTMKRPLLRIDLEDFEGNRVYAEYRFFALLNETSRYAISVHSYRGNAGDALTYHNLQPFSTFDRNTNGNILGSPRCPSEHHGAWWYRNCANANLNGRYLPRAEINREGIFWYQWKQHFTSLRSCTMKMRELRFL